MNLKEFAKDTYEYYKDKDAPRTQFYSEEDLANLPNLAENSPIPLITLVDSTFNEVVRNAKGNVALLNFASACNPGGGWLNGARAQEEAICRVSNLYNSLITLEAKPYYDAGIKARRDNNYWYTGNLIYSENVEFYKDETGKVLDKPYYADVITCAAPNLSAQRIDYTSEESIEAYYKAVTDRVFNIMKVANAHNIDTLVLGAWGCGVFKNEPHDIAKLFLFASFCSTASDIYFAVPAGVNYDAFKHEMENFDKNIRCFLERAKLEKDKDIIPD